MFKFLRRIFSLQRIRRQAYATQTRPHDNRRLIAQRLFFVTLIVFILIILRLTWLIAANNVNGVNLKKAALQNYTYTYTVYPKRGTIFDRYGVPIAQDSSNYTLYVTLDKNYVDNSGKKLYAQPSEFSKLAEFINKEIPDISASYATTQLSRGGAVQVYFGTAGGNLSMNQRDKIISDAKSEGLMGIGFDSTLTRAYPNQIFASHFIGTATAQSTNAGVTGLIGQNGGVEQALNSILEGQPSTRTVERDQYGRAIPGAIISQTPAKNGQDIYTTLDATLQSDLETRMTTLYDQFKPQQMTATLVEAKTGDILATSQRPTFNPNDMSGTKQDYFVWSNLAYQLAYEPGSTMKTFLAASAMDSGKWNGNATYDRSSLTFPDGTVIQDWDYNEKGVPLRPSVMTFAQGFAYSSNVGMGKMEEQMGYSIWGNYLQRFGFGKPTRFGIGYTTEAFGSLPKTSDAVSQVSSAFGQGVGVTMVQMLKGWTSFANAGTMLEPHYVNKIYDPNNNTVLQSSKEIIGKPISADTAKNIAQLMVTVNTDTTYGTANGAILQSGPGPVPLFVINGQPAAVKTGTAQIFENGKLLMGENDTLNSVVVLYPPENPDFIFYITIKIPAPGAYRLPDLGTQVSNLITNAELRKSEIDQTALDVPAGQIKIPDYFGKLTGQSLDEARQTLLQPVAIGNGSKVNDQSISAGTKAGANTRILLYTNGDHTMPDMYGWSKSDVDQLAKWYNIAVTYKGKTGAKGTGAAGKVTDQSIAELSIVKKDAKLTVTLGSVD